MTSPATRHPESDHRPGAAERDAWERYLAEVGALDGAAYAEAEPAAWDALQEALAEAAPGRAGLLDERAADAPPGDPRR